MNRGDAYGILADRLNQYRARGYTALLALVNEPTFTETVQHNGEDIVVDISVHWRDRQRGTVCISATASGPSTWMMQRLDERLIIRPPTATDATKKPK